MIVNWTTIKPVIARIHRNIKNIDADFTVDFPEWLAEGIFKLKTHYQLELKTAKVQMKFHIGHLPCNIDSLAAVSYLGQRMLPGDPMNPSMRQSSATNSAFISIVKMPPSVRSLDETDINNWPFYLSSVLALETMTVCPAQYSVNYNKLQCSIENGEVDIWYWSVPTDEDGLPMVPEHEDYHTALYWYVRMMMIGAGFEDKVFTYEKCEQQWKEYAPRAINDISYPSPDEVKRNIIKNVRLVPAQFDWESFGSQTPEQPFNDDLV